MYQELQLFEESFDRHPVWGTEGNDLPLPPLAVGDLFEHDSLPSINWRMPPEPGQVFKVVAIKHVFSENGRGPEANHLLKVAVALDNLADRQEAALIEAEQDLQRQTGRSDFLQSVARKQARRTAPDVLNKIVDGIELEMKSTPAHGIESEAVSAWDEAAAILQTDGHALADMLRSQMESIVRAAFKRLNDDDRLAVWLAYADLNECFYEDWPDVHAGFDPWTVWATTMGAVDEEVSGRVLNMLHEHQRLD